MATDDLNLLLLSRVCSDDIEPYMFQNPLNERSLNPGGPKVLLKWTEEMLDMSSFR